MYDEDLAARIRAAVDAAAGPVGYREIKMFGGLCWTVNTHMAVGTGDADLMVLVAAADLPDSNALDAWVGPAVERARAKPPKKSSAGA